MGSCGLAILSIMMALFGLFRSIPLAVLWAKYNGLGQMEFMIRHFEGAIDWPFLSQIATDNNASLATANSWPERLILDQGYFENRIPDTPVALESELGTQEEPQARFTGLASLPVPFIGPEFDDACAVGNLRRDVDLDDEVRGDLDPHQEPLVPKSYIWVVLLACGWIVSIASWAVTRNKHERSLRIINHEILEFLRDIQGRKADIMGKMDVVASAVESQIEQLLPQIVVERERLCTDFSTFLYEEINQLRETLQTELEMEFERQVAKVQEYIVNLESAQQTLPEPKEFEISCQTFLDEVQRSRERIDKLKTHIRSETESFVSAMAVMPQTDHAQPPCTMRLTQPVMVNGTVNSDNRRAQTERERIPTKASELQSTFLAQWRMMTGNSAMTPEEIEHGRKVRRERVERHRADNTFHQSTASIRVDEREPRSGRRSRNRPRFLCT